MQRQKSKLEAGKRARISAQKEQAGGRKTHKQKSKLTGLKEQAIRLKKSKLRCSSKEALSGIGARACARRPPLGSLRCRLAARAYQERLARKKFRPGIRHRSATGYWLLDLVLMSSKYWSSNLVLVSSKWWLLWFAGSSTPWVVVALVPVLYPSLYQDPRRSPRYAVCGWGVGSAVKIAQCPMMVPTPMPPQLSCEVRR